MSSISSTMIRICPLCHANNPQVFHQDKFREYFRCPTCRLVFVPPDQFISKQEERAQYDSHQNSPEDERYRAFLSRLFIPLNDRLAPGSSGLDFGSGPGPTLSVMFEEAGHTVTLYDPRYAPDQSVWERRYDFVTATEVIEHVRQPKKELDQIWRCLKPGGWLGLMTKLVIDRPAFVKWHYKNEPTHICFYSEETFQWCARRWRADLQFFGRDVMIFHKKIT